MARFSWGCNAATTLNPPLFGVSHTCFTLLKFFPICDIFPINEHNLETLFKTSIRRLDLEPLPPNLDVNVYF